MRLVIIESPYAGDIPKNTRYARECVRDCLDRGESPYASHLFFTQNGVLDDDIPGERTRGIAAGLAWAARSDATIVYADFGISDGMWRGIHDAEACGRPVEYRYLRPRTVRD